MDSVALMLRVADGHTPALSAMARLSPLDSTIVRTAALLMLDFHPAPLAFAVVAGLLHTPSAPLSARAISTAESALEALHAPASAALRHELRRRGKMRDVLRVLGQGLRNANDVAITKFVALASVAPSAAAGAMKGLGAEGWMRLSCEQRRSLLAAIMPYLAMHAACLGSVWGALSESERAFVQSGLHDRAIIALMTGVDADGWRKTPVDMRIRFLEAMQRSTNAPVILGTLWGALDEAERRRVCAEMTQHPQSVARLVASMGPDGWAKSSPSTQDDIICALVRDPRAAAAVGGIWSHLDHRHRVQIQQSAAKDSEASAALKEFIEDEARQRAQMEDIASGMPSAPPDQLALSSWMFERHAHHRWMLKPLTRNADGAPGDRYRPQRTSDAITRWKSLDDQTQIQIAAAAERHPEAIAELATHIGVEGWNMTHPQARERMITTAARTPESAASLALALGGAIATHRAILLPAILGAGAKSGIAHALRMGVAWRSWMHVCGASPSQHAWQEDAA